VDFEALYTAAGSDESLVPWQHGRAHPALVNWLNAEAPSLVRPGARVCVVGCGLGDDAAELIERGYDVTAFDYSPTAVAWAVRRHPSLEGRAVVADLLDLPSGMSHRFDLVVEISTLQSVDPSCRADAAGGVASLVSARGVVLVICHGRDEDQDPGDEPPYPLSLTELTGLMQPHGLCLTREPDDFVNDSGRRLFRAVFSRQ
jgi:SAM-dependent methyltransferase